MIIIVLCALLVVCLPIAALLKIWLGIRRFRRRGIQCLSVFGYMKSLLKCALGQISVQEHFLNVSHDFPGQRYIGTFELTSPLLMVRRPEAIKMICVKKAEYFINHRQVVNHDSDPLFGKMIFYTCDEKWKTMRSEINQAHTSSKLKIMFKVILEHIKENITDCKSKCENNERLTGNPSIEVDIYSMMIFYSMGFLCKLVYNDTSKSTIDQFIEVCAKSTAVRNFGLLRLLLLRYLPDCLKKVKILQPKEVEYYRKATAALYNWRKKQNAYIPDNFQMLNESKTEWTLDELSAQVLQTSTNFYDVLPNQLANLIYDIVRHPDVYNRVQSEVDRVYAETAEDLTLEDLNSMEYLDMVISETLRTWSTASATDRLCTEDCDLGPIGENDDNTLEVKKGESIFINIYAIHHNPEFWTDPHLFDPERFSKENIKSIKPYSFIPFGTGTRGCNGTRVTMMLFKTMVYHLLIEFQLSLGPNTTANASVEKFSLTTKPSKGIYLIIQPKCGLI